MIRRVLLALFVAQCGALLSQDAIVVAQQVMGSRARHITQAEVEKGLSAGTSATTGIAGGQSFQIVPDLVIRRRLSGSNNASTHSTATDGQNMTEVVVITGGSGTMMIGGTFVDQASDYQKKDRAKGITGGEVHDVNPGDAIVIPPGTAHWFTKINGQVTMIEARLPINAPAKFITKADIMKEVAKVPWGIGGQTYSIVPASEPSKANSVTVRHREKGHANDASVHSTGTDGVNATEIMFVIDGGGTFVSDGNYVDTNPVYGSKDRGKGITGGVTREVKAGDVLVYAPGTSHWYSNVPDRVTMIEVRLPGDVTKSK
jgi:mannose-6-phosphate isomerase-like protein (cupin superfamily)